MEDSKIDIGRGETLILPPRKTLVGGLKFVRHFSSGSVHPYDSFHWEKRDVSIMDYAKNKPSFVRNNVEVPAHWSDNSVRITAAKYLFGSKEGEPEYEDSFRHPFDRIANTYTVWGWKNGYFAELDDARTYNWELKAMLIRQIWAPNSPVWFNIGHWEQWRWGRPDLRERYRKRGNRAFKAIEGEGGLEVLELDNNMERPQSSACFLTEVQDSMESILRHQVVEGRIFASGSGAGLNISTLRSSHEPISGRGRSSGPISFNKGWDRMAAAIKSGGRSRRAARMILMDSDHPNIKDFIGLKNSQEDIAKIVLREHNSKVALKEYAAGKTAASYAEELVKQIVAEMPVVNEKTYDGSMDGEIYGETVSDQNANHSVSLLGDFWRAYWGNGDYSTRWVTDKSRVHETFPAKNLLTMMSESVWHNAEPGCHNNDWINLWNPVKSKGRIDTSNPCSEYLHLNGTSCNLSSFNAYRFLSEDGSIDRESLRHGVRLAMVAADLNIEECGFPDPSIALGTYTYRTTGIGYGNIGGLLMALGIPYDSDEGRYLTGLLVSHLTAYCWEASQEMGEVLGPYRAFRETSGDLAEVLRLHKAAHAFLVKIPDLSDHEEAMNKVVGEAGKLPTWGTLTGKDALRALLNSFGSGGAEWDPQWLAAAKSLQDSDPWGGVSPEKVKRNSFVSLMAPCGTISAPLGIYDEGTTSIEPDYTLVKYKTLSGGGSITMFNTLALRGLKTLGYDQWQVREAALEVAGINGLIVACDNNVHEAAEHLTGRSRETMEGPVRAAFNEYALPRGTSVLDIVTALGEGKQADLPFEVSNGRGNVEGIPWLPEHHKKVFDCAATLGGGTRAIEPAGHIRMLGVIQPFLSGSSSKTCNLPHSATVEDIVGSFELSHKMGVKCIALYRADSKGVSVYSSDSPEAERWKAESMFRKLVSQAERGVLDIQRESSRPRRRKLPGRRDGTIVKFTIGGQMEGFLVIGIYPDGRCGEVFGRLGQGGSFSHGMFESFCKAFSVMLQWGVPLPNAIESFRNTAFDPSGFARVGDGSEETGIKACKSVVDLMMRILQWLFPEENGCKIRDREGETLESEDSHAHIETPEETEARGLKIFSAAETCPACGALSYIQDGKCKRCCACGHSGGGCGG